MTFILSEIRELSTQTSQESKERVKELHLRKLKQTKEIQDLKDEEKALVKQLTAAIDSARKCGGSFLSS